MFLCLCHLVTFADVASAYSAAKPVIKRNVAPPGSNSMTKAFVTVAASASLAFVLVGSPLHADANIQIAGQISLNTIPPTSVNVNVKDLPVIGNIVSGTYTRVNEKDIASPSVTISSPKDKLGFIKSATKGHVELDLGGLLVTHVDIDVAADEAGVLTARVSSPLIPKLPFKKLQVAMGV